MERMPNLLTYVFRPIGKILKYLARNNYGAWIRDSTKYKMNLCHHEIRLAPPNCAMSRSLTLLAALAATGCSVGPAYHAPAPIAAAYWYAPLPHAGNGAELGLWWRQFDDPVLGALITTAERDSPTVAQALARIAQARVSLTASAAASYPSANASAQSTRSESVSSFFSGMQTASSLAVDAVWELDLFGANRRGREAAVARVQARAAAWHDARVSLAAEVADNYMNLRACEALVAGNRQDLTSRRDSARLTQLKADNGFSSRADAALGNAQAAQAEARLTAQQAECDLSIKALVALTGQAEPALRRQLASRTAQLPHLPSSGVTSVPAQLLGQRPDLAVAERDLAATSADIGAAEARRYPSISLSGSIGLAAVSFGGLSSKGNTWSFGPTVKLPLFDGGKSRANVADAQARYDEALANYQQRARIAVKEVEQALVKLDSATMREGSARAAALGYQIFFNASKARLKIGSGSLLDMEEARHNLLSSEASLVNIQRERLAAWISLYKAMGGGWMQTAGEPGSIANSP